jgi:hypothetical protein
MWAQRHRVGFRYQRASKETRNTFICVYVTKKASQVLWHGREVEGTEAHKAGLRPQRCESWQVYEILWEDRLSDDAEGTFGVQENES